MDIRFSFSWRLFLKSIVAMTILLSFYHDSLIGACKTNVTEARIVSETKDVISGTKRIGRIRYHYFDQECVDDTSDSLANTSLESCSDILLLGVGAAMSVDNYDNIAKQIVNKTGSSSLIVVIADSNPGNIVKFSSTKFADLSNHIHLHSGLIPVCNKTDENEKRTVNFLIGGHSASGQAALEAAQQGLFDFCPTGFVGLDPYDTSTIHSTLDFFPTLNWGFTHTTCLVQVDKAAKGAYEVSSPDIGRVLYSIDNNNNNNNGMTHCVFTDHGCKVAGFDVCSSHGNHEWVYESVAESINLFVNATKNSLFDKDTFEVPSTRSGKVSLFVNHDKVDRNMNIHASLNSVYDIDKDLSGSTQARLILVLMIMAIIALVWFLQHQWLQRYNFILYS